MKQFGRTKAKLNVAKINAEMPYTGSILFDDGSMENVAGIYNSLQIAD